MPTITWNTDVNAPCCPGEILAEDGRSILVQVDTDYPGVASTFGWSPDHVQACPDCGQVQQRGYVCEECGAPMRYCPHDGTDGTVDCPDCGIPSTDFIGAAREYLADHDGAMADDPGYFA